MEILRVLARCVAVPLPAALVLGLAELTYQDNGDGYGVFLTAMVLALGLAGVWAARDVRHAPTAWVVARWVAVSVLVAATLAILTVVLAPGSPRDEAVVEAAGLAQFYGVPLLVAAGVGSLIASQKRRQLMSR